MELAILLNEFVNDETEDFLNLQWYLALIDIMLKWDFLWINEARLSNVKLQINLISFSQTKKLKSSSLSKILRCKNILSKMRSDISKDDIPMVTCRLQKPIRSKWFNHKKFVESFNINLFIQTASITPCQGENDTTWPHLNRKSMNCTE